MSGQSGVISVGFGGYQRATTGDSFYSLLHREGPGGPFDLQHKLALEHRVWGDE